MRKVVFGMLLLTTLFLSGCTDTPLEVSSNTVEYVDYDGTVLQTEDYDFGADLSGLTAPTDPTIEGYTFDAWSGTLPTTMGTDKITVTAAYTVNQYTVEYVDYGGTVLQTEDYDFGADLSGVRAPTDPTREGYTFDSWSGVVPIIMGTNKVTLKATYIMMEEPLVWLSEPDRTAQSISLDIEITDNDLTFVSAKASIYDGEVLLDEVEISLGIKNIVFDTLLSDYEYLIKIEVIYNISDGTGNYISSKLITQKTLKPFNLVQKILFSTDGDTYVSDYKYLPEVGYLLLGNTKGSNGDVIDGNNGEQDMLIEMYDIDGLFKWQRTLGGHEQDYSFAVDVFGEYILVAGYTKSYDGDISSGNIGESDAVFFILDQNGGLIDDITIGDEYHDAITDFVISENYIYAIYHNNSKMYVKKYNENFEEIQSFSFQGLAKSNFSSTIISSTENYLYISGERKNSSAKSDAVIIKLNTDLEFQWELVLNGREDDSIKEIIENSDGNIIIIGSSYSYDQDYITGNKGNADTFIAGVSPLGELLWLSTFGTEDGDWALDIILMDDNKLLLLSTNPYPNVLEEMLMLSVFNSDGSIECQFSYDIRVTSASGFILGDMLHILIENGSHPTKITKLNFSISMYHNLK